MLIAATERPIDARWLVGYLKGARRSFDNETKRIKRRELYLNVGNLGKEPDDTATRSIVR